MLLRRLAHNLLALFRSVPPRSDETRQMPWKDLIRKVCHTLIAATDADIEALRPRMVLTASVA